MKRKHWFGAPLAALSVLLAVPGATQAAAAPAPTAPAPAAGCRLPSAAGVSHVIYLQFDNVHFRRDDPNVPSDLEQMPNLLDFLKGQGVLLTNHHTPLIAHTADDIITSITGLYGDRQGIPVSNGYRQYNASGSTSFSSSFKYWTDTTPNGSFNQLAAAGTNTPAPWVPFTRAGCNVGAAGTANIELEGLRDVASVYGPSSPEEQEVLSGSPSAYPDFVGISVHCAQGAALCSPANHGVADVLPSEPGGYPGFDGLFGHKYVAPQISPNGPLTDIDGNPIQDVFNGITTPGFPGFDGMSAAVTLGYVAAMQEHGLPVTYGYISAAHVDANGNDAGPGQADYVQRLKQYDEAWGKFFARLRGDGITPANTLFVITADENDHFAGGPGSPAGCDGVHAPCTYSAIGEVSTNLAQLMQQAGNAAPFTMQADTSPSIYLQGAPARDAAVTRQFERTMWGLQVDNPITGQHQRLLNWMVDPVGLQLLHMVTADPQRTPTFTAFAKPDYWVSNRAADCSDTAAVIECPPSFGEDAWMHGDLFPQINDTWAGIVGPGVRQLGEDGIVWSDHADLRPTILLLTGLRDDYTGEGRPLFELVDPRFLPRPLREQRDDLLRLAQAYKQLDAPVGRFALAGVAISTLAVAGDDARYAQLEDALATLTARRDALAAQMLALIDGAAFGGPEVRQVRSRDLTAQAAALIERASELAGTGDD